MAFFCFSDKPNDFQPLGSWERMTTTGAGVSAFASAAGGSVLLLVAGLSSCLGSWARARRDSKDTKDDRTAAAIRLNMVRTPTKNSPSGPATQLERGEAGLRADFLMWHGLCRRFRQASKDSASIPKAKWPGPLVPCAGKCSLLVGPAAARTAPAPVAVCRIALPVFNSR